MTKKICVIEVNSCDGCPHFDNEYYSYNERCVLLNRCVRFDTEQDSHPIPDDCPLSNADIIKRPQEEE